MVNVLLNYENFIFTTRHGGAGVSAVASQQEGPRFQTSLVLVQVPDLLGPGPGSRPPWSWVWDLSVWSFMFSLCLVGFLQVLQLPPTVQTHAEVNWRL